MSLLKNGWLAKQEAAGSTSKGAFPAMPIRSMASVKPTAKANPFVSFHWLILLESHRKPKKTPPKHTIKMTSSMTCKSLSHILNKLPFVPL
jgi:hypothetical protein